MKLTLEQGEVSLPKNFAFQVRSTHPFFSDEGTATVPATIPATPENMEIFAYPTNTHRSTRPLRVFHANLLVGLFNKNCKVVMDSADIREGINVSLALEESDMYVTSKDKKLTDLFNEQVVAERVALWNRFKFNDTVSPAILNKLVAFPVVAGLSDGDTAETILNNPGQGFIVPDTITVSGETIPAPAGYSVTPFIFLWALIEETFTRCGYRVTSNVFRATSQLKDIVVLNNCADVYTSYTADEATFNLSQIVPNITVGDFINFLRDKFGAVVSVVDNSVRIRLMDDILASAADEDLSKYLRGNISVSYPKAKTLRIGCDTGNDGAGPAGESFEKLVASYRDVSDVITRDKITGPGFFFVQSLCRYYHKVANQTAKHLGAESFDYCRTVDADVDVEEIKTDDLFVSMFDYQGRFVPLIDKAVRRNMEVSDVDNDYEQKIQLCYAHFDAEFHGLNHIYARTSDVNTIIYNNLYDGLHPEGIYKRFWQKYHRLILDGAPELSCTMAIPISKLISLDLWTPKHINGMNVIIKEITYSLSHLGASSCEVILQQLPTYTDSIEIIDPAFNSILHWHLVSTRTIFNRVVETDGLTDYTEDDAPDYTLSQKGVKVGFRARWLKYQKPLQRKGITTYKTIKHEYEEYFITE